MSLKNWRRMAYTVCHVPIPVTSQICSCSNYDVIWYEGDVIGMSFSHGTKHDSLFFNSCNGNRSVASSHIIRGEHGLQSMPYSPRVIGEELMKFIQRKSVIF